jgi:hypothetical protein
MNDTHLVVLAIEVDPSMGDPADWHWPTLVDSPYAVDVVAAIRAEDNVSVVDNLKRLARRWEQ